MSNAHPAIAKLSFLAQALIGALCVSACHAAERPAARVPAHADVIVVALEGSGSVYGAGGDIDCRPGARTEACRATPSSVGAPVLDATAADGWRFERWEISRVGDAGEPEPGFLDPSFRGPTRAVSYKAVFVPVGAKSAKAADERSW